MFVLWPPATSSQRARAGFTLLELLVAITILGLMMPLLYAVTQTGMHAWSRSQSHFHHTMEIQSVQAYLRRQVHQIYPKYQSSGAINAHVAFDGGKAFVQFLVPAVGQGLDGGMLLMKLMVVREGDDLRLVMTQSSELALDEGSELTRTILLKGLKSAAFSYFGKDDLQTLPVWHDSWSGQKGLPKLVRLQATFVDGSQVWPDLMVAPQIDVDVGCIYDPLTKYCQGR
jgi:general secretion pathway protein J